MLHAASQKEPLKSLSKQNWRKGERDKNILEFISSWILYKPMNKKGFQP